MIRCIHPVPTYKEYEWFILKLMKESKLMGLKPPLSFSVHTLHQKVLQKDDLQTDENDLSVLVWRGKSS